MKDFFISYNHNDKEMAKWVAGTLEEYGYTTIIQEWDFLPGNNIVVEMQKAILECKKIILILSEAYLASEFCQAEWASIFYCDPTGKKRQIIPIRVKNIKPEGLLSNIIYIDLFDHDEKSATSELLNGVDYDKKKRIKSDFPFNNANNANNPCPMLIGNFKPNNYPVFGREYDISKLVNIFTDKNKQSHLVFLMGAEEKDREEVSKEVASRLKHYYKAIIEIDAASVQSAIRILKMIYLIEDSSSNSEIESFELTVSKLLQISRRNKYLLIINRFTVKEDRELEVLNTIGMDVLFLSPLEWEDIKYPCVKLSYKSVETYKEELNYYNDLLMDAVAIIIANNRTKDKNIAYLNYRIGIIHTALGNHIEAYNYFEEAANIFTGIPFSELMLSKIYLCMGNNGNSVGDYKTALECLNKSIDYRKDFMEEKDFETASLCEAVGHTYFRIGDFASAWKFHRKSLNIFKELYKDDDSALAVHFYNAGRDCAYSEQYELGIEYLSKARSIWVKCKGNAYEKIREIDELIFSCNMGIGDVGKEDDIVILTDNNGEEVPFQLLDCIKDNGKEYVCLLPVNPTDSDDEGKVIILETKEDTNFEQYSSVTDINIVNRIYTLFVERNKNNFDFV